MSISSHETQTRCSPIKATWMHGCNTRSGQLQTCGWMSTSADPGCLLVEARCSSLLIEYYIAHPPSTLLSVLNSRAIAEWITKRFVWRERECQGAAKKRFEPSASSPSRFTATIQSPVIMLLHCCRECLPKQDASRIGSPAITPFSSLRPPPRPGSAAFWGLCCLVELPVHT